MKGAQAHNEYYRSIYGDRWPALRQALATPVYHVARTNSFYLREDPDFPTRLTKEQKQTWGLENEDPDLPGCYRVNEHFGMHLFTTPLLPFYKMDPASIFAAKALEVKPGETVLDMCAAPGDKTLVLCEDMLPGGQVIANEPSSQQRFRMMSMFKSYLPTDIRSQVDVNGHDAAFIGMKMPKHFDRILLEAPCSEDRILVQKPSELEGWSEKRINNMSNHQYALLASAYLALKPGGTIVYSTSALSPQENDDVIAKLFKKKKNAAFEVLRRNVPRGEATEHGHMILPDAHRGGPIYFSVIRKKEDE